MTTVRNPDTLTLLACLVIMSVVCTAAIGQQTLDEILREQGMAEDDIYGMKLIATCTWLSPCASESECSSELRTP